ncbi:hypothetical protein KP509_07G096700 [Ceratopteris richardii]|uniref:Uncharacterized protein n=1 Tax=Ceratopteris richardii TaxID=49495 RepID=A0A8T2UKL3_CERRI|nr:hypothetical protein KP509_07G096700 [Ceratopteris richardii]
MKIPIYRIVAHDNDPCDCAFAADGCLTSTMDTSLPGACIAVPAMWSAEIGSIIREELECSKLPKHLFENDNKSTCCSITKENFQSVTTGSSLLAGKISEETSKDLSPRKRGILSENSSLGNRPALSLKRQRLHEVADIKDATQTVTQLAPSKPVQIPCSAEKLMVVAHQAPGIVEKMPVSDSFKRNLKDSEAARVSVQPMFQTASSKPVQFSLSAMQKAKALLNINDIESCIPLREGEPSPFSGSMEVANVNVNTSNDYYSGVKGYTTANNVVNQIHSQPMFQTASSKPVQFSLSAMQKAKMLFNFDDVDREGEWPPCNGPLKVSNMNVKTSSDHYSGVTGYTTAKNIVNRSKNAPMQIATELSAHFNHVRENPVSSSKIALKQPVNVDGEGPCFHSDALCIAAVGHEENQHHPKTPSCLFQTGTGKAVSISRSGMRRAEKLFTSEEASFSHKNIHTDIFHTATGKSVSLSSAAVSQTSNLLAEGKFPAVLEEPSAFPPNRFVTGMGKSVSVSSNAMQRAKNLLGVDMDDNFIPPPQLVNKGELNSQQVFETSEGHLIKVSSGSLERARVLLKDGAKHTSSDFCKMPSSNLDIHRTKTDDMQEFSSLKSGKGWQTYTLNELDSVSLNKTGSSTRKSVASFKAPRRLQPLLSSSNSSSSKETPFHLVEHDFSLLVNLHTQYKEVKTRVSLKDYFMQLPHQDEEIRHLTDDTKTITSESAKSFRFSTSTNGLESVGPEEFKMMLLQSGANSQVVTKEWVDNHYRWIIWKLASLERSYPSKLGNKLLTIQMVFNELKYRYKREVECAHRSAIKKITEGDAVAGRMMVLCVATVSIREQAGSNVHARHSAPSSENPKTVFVELTDGWYSLIAHLDPPLIRHLRAGKIFSGQKLRVCGATLMGCTNPMPPLEAFHTMRLALHINGTFRAHWMDKLGLCKRRLMPLAFHCIKPNGGSVPSTIVGIRRIYPILYQERLPDGRSITRSARAEDFAVRGYHDRRSEVAEEAVMRMEQECLPLMPECDLDEGAKIFQLLEKSAEPELLMADMSAAQHAAFSAYQAKREAARQSLAQKNISKALVEVHLDARKVTPLMRVSVVGLCFLDSKGAYRTQNCNKKKGGIVTIWHVTEEQVDSLNEGSVYCVSNLCPFPGRHAQDVNSNVLHLRATKASRWQLLPQAVFSCFLPRSVQTLSRLGMLPFRSEFDVAILIIHVGKPYACGRHQRQWLFASDGSVEEDDSTESRETTSLLAIEVSALNDAYLPVERSLEGCIVGYCNLVKRCRDQRNCMWVAETSEGSVFSSNLNTRIFLHLKEAGGNVRKWANSSEQCIAELEDRIQKAVAG